MKKIGFLLVTFFFFSAVSAQPSEPAKTWAFAYGAAGAVVNGGSADGVLHIGGGGAGLVSGGLGAGVDIGYLAPFEGFGSGIGILSPGVLYAFNRENATVPYVGGGYTLFFRGATAHGFYVAGGINRWFDDRWGIQIEGRDQIMPEYNDHFIEARVSILIR
ncbi:MAG: hypothetical protein JSU96_12570 [Acidobacteriota bacterium]|nr:MAG: hypothetical protein JSU96_12570 [Acidobacteriota bacterium]